MLEHGGHGGEAAGPVVKAVYDYLFGPVPAALKAAAKPVAQPQAAQGSGD
jgi:penicillin-binding protein 2